MLEDSKELKEPTTVQTILERIPIEKVNGNCYGGWGRANQER